MIPWIQVYSNVVAHPKTTRLAEELELKSGCVHPRIVAVGMLVAIWTWAVQNAYDGDLSRVSPTVIAEACRWKKAPRKLWDALVASGYLDSDGHLHDWDEYAVLFMDAEERRREKSRERSLRYRQRKEAKRHACVTVTSVTNHAPTIPYQNHTENDVDNDDTSFLSERVREEKPSPFLHRKRGEGGPLAVDEGSFELPSSGCALRRSHLPPFSAKTGEGVLGICPHPSADKAADTFPRKTGEGIDGVDASVRAAIRRRWGRDADERDLARGRREFVFFGENGGLRAYDGALVDYVFSVSEGAGEKAQNWRFIEGVMRKLRQRGIITVEDALDYEEERGI